MTMSDDEGLIARIRQVRRLGIAGGRPNRDVTDSAPDPSSTLESRVEHLERQLEALQDSVHRESERQNKLIAELQNQVRPAAMGAALAEDQRSRGL
jgi:hypothetical protein